jgi:hypothetical protein
MIPQTLFLKLAPYAIVALISASFGSYIEHLRFVNYKNKIELQSQQQIIKTKTTEVNQAHVTTTIQSDFVSKLAALNAYYSSVLDSPKRSTISPMPKHPIAPARTNGTSSNSLSRACAKTTLMLIELQTWIKDETTYNDN